MLTSDFFTLQEKKSTTNIYLRFTILNQENSLFRLTRKRVTQDQEQLKIDQNQLKIKLRRNSNNFFQLQLLFSDYLLVAEFLIYSPHINSQYPYDSYAS